jgi:hypothetical protein
MNCPVYAEKGKMARYDSIGSLPVSEVTSVKSDVPIMRLL